MKTTVYFVRHYVEHKDDPIYTLTKTMDDRERLYEMLVARDMICEHDGFGGGARGSFHGDMSNPPSYAPKGKYWNGKSDPSKRKG